MMHETCLLAEVAIPHFQVFDELRNLCPRPTDTVESIAMAAVSASLELNAGAILVLTTRYGLYSSHVTRILLTKSAVTPHAFCPSTVPSVPSSWSVAALLPHG